MPARSSAGICLTLDRTSRRVATPVVPMRRIVRTFQAIDVPNPISYQLGGLSNCTTTQRLVVVQFADRLPKSPRLRKSSPPNCTTTLALHEKRAAAETAHAKTALERQIQATDRQIDRLVYELYGLTEAEIKIVEEATAK